jgi:hypothetical protein
MKPRVFVSSTYFDLKHVRERIERFIENYNFEPVLFESDSVTFEHNTPLDISCYNEVKLCHIMVLIIGGRYGSIISGENIDEKIAFYNKEYTSITRKEYETAMKMNIPTFVFIEKNVYAEYHTYNKNKDFFDKELTTNIGNKFSFAHVDDVNVFKFINTIKELAIKTFDKIEDIENYLGNQIAGMLYLYLEGLQNKNKEEKILDSVSELKSISKRMNEMLTAVGKNVIKDAPFEEVIFEQNKILIDFFIEHFFENIQFKDYFEASDKILEDIYNLVNETFFNQQTISIYKTKDPFDQHQYLSSFFKNFERKLLKIDTRLTLSKFHPWNSISNYINKIHPLIENDDALKNYMKEQFFNFLYDELRLPF